MGDTKREEKDPRRPFYEATRNYCGDGVQVESDSFTLFRNRESKIRTVEGRLMMGHATAHAYELGDGIKRKVVLHLHCSKRRQRNGDTETLISRFAIDLPLDFARDLVQELTFAIEDAANKQ